jgi:hypothetical protein
MIALDRVNGMLTPGDQRNVSAMIAAMKPNVPNQLAISINSSVIRQASPFPVQR